MATHSAIGGAQIGPTAKRPPFSVEYYNNEALELSDSEREHRIHQFKALTGFDSYSEFMRDFYRRSALYWRLLHRGPHLPPAVILAPYLNRENTLNEHPAHHTKLTPLDEFALPFRKLASLATNGQLAADYDMSPGHFDALMLNIATLVAVFWAPDYFLFSDYIRSRGADPSQHIGHLHHHFREGLDETLFDYLKHAMIRKRRSHEAPPMVDNEVIYQQAQAIAAIDIGRRQQQAQDTGLDASQGV